MKITLNNFFDIYTGPRLTIFVTGGGFSIVDLLKIPGASSYIGGIYAPYSLDQIVNLCSMYEIYDDDIGKCNCQATLAYTKLLDIITQGLPEDDCKIVINAALTSNRPRKDDNRFYYSINGNIEYEELPKLDDKFIPDFSAGQRLAEDLYITNKVLNKICSHMKCI